MTKIDEIKALEELLENMKHAEALKREESDPCHKIVSDYVRHLDAAGYDLSHCAIDMDELDDMYLAMTTATLNFYFAMRKQLK